MNKELEEAARKLSARLYDEAFKEGQVSICEGEDSPMAKAEQKAREEMRDKIKEWLEEYSVLAMLSCDREVLLKDFDKEFGENNE